MMTVATLVNMQGIPVVLAKLQLQKFWQTFT